MSLVEIKVLGILFSIGGFFGAANAMYTKSLETNNSKSKSIDEVAFQKKI